MSTTKPKQTLNELLLEAQLTRQKYLVVEGPSDAGFFRTWLRSVVSGNIIVTSVEEIDVPTAEVISLGLNDGNRSRVIVVSRRALGRPCNLMCVADRDVGQDVDAHSQETLIWTDFPGLESYTFTLETLQVICDVHTGGRLPAAAELHEGLRQILCELFAVRAQHNHLPKPNYRAGFTTKPPRMDAFDVALTVDPRIRADIAAYPRPMAADPREYAYGHDIAEVMYVLFANELKNSAGLSSPRALEAALATAGFVGGAYEGSRLFDSLRAWAS